MRKTPDDRFGKERIRISFKHPSRVHWNVVHGQRVRSFGRHWKIVDSHMVRQHDGSFESSLTFNSRLTAKEAMCLSVTGSLN